ncbi:hypothetical protein BCV70DRAFT_45568 [Testicularia cyperi]|uniref:Alpha/beta-hydrolase n=1 Tax=Testicularia cyperi TaxID=1882483 RepID=A0A317XHQ1_9BASI|nr:hypothetical protein BCV70DRAFT_45568 [Testicularia cyperi]
MASASLASHLALPLVASFAGAQTLWWPSATASAPRVVLVFIPGNPGLSSYYINFLHSIYSSKSLSSSSIEIVSISQRGHAPLPAVGDSPVWGDNLTNQKQAAKGYGTRLQDQVRHKVAVVDAIRRMYPDREKTKLVVVGHSIGAWMAIETLKKRPEQVDGVHLLFPTLAWIGRTPNARRLRLLLNPVVRDVVLPLPLLMLSMLPLFLLLRLVSLFTAQPLPAALATADLLKTPGAVRNALRMAREEFKTVQGLETSTIETLRKFSADEEAANKVQGRGYVRSYWASDEMDSWAPGWIRSQVETELQLHRVHLPPSLNLSAARSSASGRNGKEQTTPGRLRSNMRTRSFSVSEYRSSPGSIPNLRNAKAIRRPNGEIVIEAEINEPSSESEDDAQNLDTLDSHANGTGSSANDRASQRALNYHLGRFRATSTHCKIGMPHAFCVHHSDEMAQIVSHWISHDHLQKD